MTKKNVSTRILRWVKKIKSINKLGGKCEICNDDNIFHLVFHHLYSEEKEDCINNMLNLKWSIIEKELDKCQLLCANCHKELHFNKDFKNSSSNITIKRRENKQILIEYKNCKCEKCNYDKNNQSLSFHHLKDKKFIFNAFRNDINIIELQDYIKKELDNCILLCQNCHIEEHSDVEFFNNHKKEIYDKVINYKEKQSKLPINEIMKLYKNGMKQIDISKKYNASKGTISDIIKNNKFK